MPCDFLFKAMDAAPAVINIAAEAKIVGAMLVVTGSAKVSPLITVLGTITDKAANIAVIM